MPEVAASSAGRVEPRLSHTAIVVPIYRERLPQDEAYALGRSLPLVAQRPVYFLAPAGLDLSWYSTQWPTATVRRYPDEYFASIRGYNLLLLSPEFYRGFDQHEFLLVLQTDAILLSDELDHWAGQPYDYVGALWPQGIEIDVKTDRFAGDLHQRVRAKVGNGGLSVRRIRKCIALLQEFPQALEVPDSVLWLMSRSELSQRHLREEAAKAGIDPARLVFAQRVQRVEDHLARYRQADLVLDTHPYNAHTTAADALLAGLRVLTYRGQSFPARVAASLPHATGLPELVTDSLAGYEALALVLARDPARRTALRSQLDTHRQQQQALLNTASFTRDLEAIYVAMWRHSQLGAARDALAAA